MKSSNELSFKFSFTILLIFSWICLTNSKKIKKVYNCPCESLESNKAKDIAVINACIDVHSYDKLFIYLKDTPNINIIKLPELFLDKVNNPFLPGDVRYHDLKEKKLLFSKFNCSIVLYYHQMTQLSNSISHKMDFFIEQNRVLCPDYCSPVPFLPISQNIFDIFKHENIQLEPYKEVSILCSLTIGTLLSIINKNNVKMELKNNMILQSLIYYKVAECNDKMANHYYHKGRLASDYSKKKVEAVIIWVGTVKDEDLIKDQQSILSNLPHKGKNAVVGWFSSEIQYPCREGTTKCTSKYKTRQYRYLPQSQINRKSHGWACAQRRPLRTLSHILLFYDPEFIILLDDDTFLNYPLLMKKFSTLIYGDMKISPILLGEYIGYLRPIYQGMIPGGSGYVIGKKLIEILNSKEVKFFGFELATNQISKSLIGYDKPYDDFRSTFHAERLSLVRDGLSHANIKCNEPQKCIDLSSPRLSSYERDNSKINFYAKASKSNLIHPSRDYILPIGVRLIEFCTNLYANEKTCHHSDHSIQHCLFYGAYAIPFQVYCYSDNITDITREMGMCYHTIECDLERFVTCHRYRAHQNSTNLQSYPTPVYNHNRKFDEESIYANLSYSSHLSASGKLNNIGELKDFKKIMNMKNILPH